MDRSGLGMAGHVLLTGATGLVGRYLLRDLLLKDTPVAVLIRSSDKETAVERLEKVMVHWDQTLRKSLPRPVCLEGDITSPGLGLSREDRSWISRNCPRVLHNAASLAFWGKDRSKDPWLSNLTGTANLLEACHALRIRELHYMSTAYVCGKREGTIYESELDCGQEFRNDYEQAKFEAEKLVHTADFIDNLTLYRPAVITGDSQTGYTSTYHGLYTYLQFTWLFIQYLEPQPDGRYHAKMRLNLTGEETRNLIPVDWVSAATTELFLNKKNHGKTYHLTPLIPVTAKLIENVMSGYFNYYGPYFAGPDALSKGDLNYLETMFYQYVSRYETYWVKEPTFDCKNTLQALPHLPCPPIDHECMRRLIDFAVNDRWGKRRESKNGVLAHSKS